MTQWNATVEYDRAVAEDQGAELAGRGEFTVVSIDAGRGRTRISFGVAASTLRQATDATHRTARELTTGVDIGQAVAVRILTDEDLAAELERPTIPPLVDSTGAREILGVSQQRLSELLTTRVDFPQPIDTFAGGRHVWVRAAIEGFEKRWVRKPGRPSSTDRALERMSEPQVHPERFGVGGSGTQIGEDQ